MCEVYTEYISESAGWNCVLQSRAAGAAQKMHDRELNIKHLQLQYRLQFNGASRGPLGSLHKLMSVVRLQSVTIHQTVTVLQIGEL